MAVGDWTIVDSAPADNEDVLACINQDIGRADDAAFADGASYNVTMKYPGGETRPETFECIFALVWCRVRRVGDTIYVDLKPPTLGRTGPNEGIAWVEVDSAPYSDEVLRMLNEFRGQPIDMAFADGASYEYHPRLPMPFPLGKPMTKFELPEIMQRRYRRSGDYIYIEMRAASA